MLATKKKYLLEHFLKTNILKNQKGNTQKQKQTKPENKQKLTTHLAWSLPLPPGGFNTPCWRAKSFASDVFSRRYVLSAAWLWRWQRVFLGCFFQCFKSFFNMYLGVFFLVFSYWFLRRFFVIVFLLFVCFVTVIFCFVTVTCCFALLCLTYYFFFFGHGC